MDISDLQVLVVEDETFQRNILIKILDNLGVGKVYGAEDGIEALKLIQKNACDIDILICDLMMPGMDGMELLRHMSEMKCNLPTIITSGLEHTLVLSIKTMAQAYGVHVLGIIEKPVSKKKIELLLQKYISLPKVKSKIGDRRRYDRKKFTNNEVLEALKNDEFEVYVQPKVELLTGTVKGAEALARWIHPEKGIISPDNFIPFMERNGLIDDLTWIMLKKTAAFCLQWLKKGLNITLSVNLSLLSLTNPQLAEKIYNIVTAEGLDPHNIVLEITESTTATHIAVVLENLSRLRMKGFGLSIDDYGTGYSTMQQLLKIAYTELKIDQSFVTDAALNESTRIILGSSLDMARKLKITSVAEGVESKEDYNYLKELGCDIAQGYLIAKPMPAGKFYDWAVHWRKNGFHEFTKEDT